MGSCCNKGSTGGPAFSGFPGFACQHFEQIEQDNFIACLFSAINHCTCDYDLLFKDLLLVQVLYWQLQRTKVILKLRTVEGPAPLSAVKQTSVWINRVSSSTDCGAHGGRHKIHILFQKTISDLCETA